MGTGSFPGVQCGRGVLLTLLCRGHGRVELNFYPPSGPNRACNGITLPLPFNTIVCIYWLKFSNVLSRRKGLFVAFVKIGRSLNFVIYVYKVFNFDEDERNDDDDDDDDDDDNNNSYYYYYEHILK